jgi:hypothetical protein
VSDYYLPDGEAKNLFPLPFDLLVIVLTATYDVNLAVALMKLGVDVNPIEMLSQARMNDED